MESGNEIQASGCQTENQNVCVSSVNLGTQRAKEIVVEGQVG